MNESASEYDYIIIGAGAAGSVLANRLSADGKLSVCVIEAGGKDRNPFIHLPAGFIKTLNNPALTWSFSSQPAPGSAGRAVNLPQGRVLGGSTSINGLVYNRGQAEDFDEWAASGNSGWSYQEVLPYFRRSETRPQIDSQFRGAVGPMTITDPGWRDPLCDTFVRAVAELGAPEHNDYNGESQFGAGYYQRYINGRRRVSAATSFLKPAMRRQNLTVLTNVRVEKIRLHNKRATGVILRDCDARGNCVGEPRSLSARREVLLSAGTVNSARLLQLSGIGPGPLLQSLEIPVQHDLPAVGENLQDHYFVRCTTRMKEGVISLNQRARGLSLLSHIVRWGVGLPNILTLSPSMAYAFVSSSGFPPENEAEPNTRPDLQFVFSPGSYKPGHVYQLDDLPGATCGFTQQRPESRGYVRLSSSDVNENPVIQPNYLEAEIDQRVTVRGIRLCRKIFESHAFDSVIDRQLAPAPSLSTDAELLEFARETGNTGYHLCGSCRMGPAESSDTVVSPTLEVHGLSGLRVIDASIMPNVTSSNTCAASIMIGEKGADLVLESV